MTPVEEPMPDSEGTTGLAAWLWIVIVIGVVMLALAGLVEWMR
jgi:TRAP-type mannitol/chloroaromatic compound transport system permease small subunit